MTKFIRQGWLSYKAKYSFVSPINYFINMILNPTLQLSFFAIMIKFAYSENNISTWIIGNSFLLASMNSVFIVGNLVRGERSTGTLKYLIASPINKFKIFMSLGLFHSIDITLRVSIGFIVGYLFFNFDLLEINLLMLTLSILSGMLSGLAFGMLIGSIAFVTTEIHIFLNSMEQILILFTGALFSVNRLPSQIRWISEVVPLRKSIEASRLLLTNDSSNFYNLLLQETTLSIIMMVLGYYTFQFFSNLAKKKASIDLY